MCAMTHILALTLQIIMMPAHYQCIQLLQSAACTEHGQSSFDCPYIGLSNAQNLLFGYNISVAGRTFTMIVMPYETADCAALI